MKQALPYIFIVILIAFSAFFSGSEIAYASLNATRLKHKAGNGKFLDKLTLHIYESYDVVLIAILIGNNLVNIGSSTVATTIAISLLGDQGAWIATFIITVLVLTFGEITPKIIATRTAPAFAKAVSVPLTILICVLRPLVWLFEKALNAISRLWTGFSSGEAITEDDLETIIDTVEEEGVVDEDLCDMLQSALDFDDVLAYEIVTPRVDMYAIDIDDPLEEQKKVLLESNYSRVPVYKDTVDNIIGIINLNQWLLQAATGNTFSIEEAMTEPLFVHQTMPIPDVLALMQKEKTHLVVVTDEYGGTEGILTLEDILEQLVGEIWDEQDVVEPELECLQTDIYRVDGSMRILDLLEELDVDDRDFDEENATVGGWAIDMLGDYAEVGDSFSYRNLTFTVTEIENLRVLKMIVQVAAEEDEEKE